MLNIAALAQSRLFTIGADTGWSTEYESKGMKFYNWQGEECECTQAMRSLGFDAIRIRVWVDPEGAGKGPWCGIDDVLTKALRAKEQGMDIMLAFHYSDWWADPAKQNIPHAWEGHSYKKTLADLREHTTSVLRKLKDNGITLRWIQVGNDTSSAMLWPIESNPQQYAGLFKAGYEAAKSIYPDAKVLVHLDNGWDREQFEWNLDILKDNGAQWDLIGMSLYPYKAMQAGKESNAEKTIVDCIRNIKFLAKKYGTDAIITETGYEVDESQPWKMHLGRRHFTELLTRAMNETEGHCQGVFYWEPECRPSQHNLGAFTEDGHPTDILRAIATVRPEAVSGYDRKRVDIQTGEGDITVELYNETPLHRDNFLSFASNHHLDGTTFHRVIKDFMIQGGDQEDTTSIAAEIPMVNGQPRFIHKRGAIAAARESDDVNPQLRSGATEFYIVWGSTPPSAGKRPYVPMSGYYNEYASPGTPWLDGGYTVFGEVVSGLEVVDKIQQTASESYAPLIKGIKGE